MWIIANICVLALDIVATVVSYQSGNYGMALSTGVCAGVVFTDIIWMVKEEIEE